MVRVPENVPVMVLISVAVNSSRPAGQPLWLRIVEKILRNRRRAVMKAIGRGQGGRAAVWIAMLAIFGTRTVQAGINNGPRSGRFCGSARALAIDPQNPDLFTPVLVAECSKQQMAERVGDIELRSARRDIARTLVIDPATRTRSTPGSLRCLWSLPVFKSTDGAQSWSSDQLGLEAVIVVESLTIDPQNAGTLYAGTAHASKHQGLPDGWKAARISVIDRVFKTTDGGLTWKARTQACRGTGGLWVHQRRHDRSAESKAIYVAASGLGVFKSTDGGASWKNSLLNRGGAALTIDPQNPSTLYAADWSGVLKTTDGGANWNGVNSGLPENCCGSLVIDPQNPNTIYAGGRYDQGYADGRFGIFVSTRRRAGQTQAWMAPYLPRKRPLTRQPSVTWHLIRQPRHGLARPAALGSSKALIERVLEAELGSRDRSPFYRLALASVRFRRNERAAVQEHDEVANGPADSGF